MPDASQLERRQFLSQLVRFLFLVGLLAFTWIIISSLSSTHLSENNKSDTGIEIELSDLQPGELKKIALQHKEVWVYYRSDKDIEQLKKQNHSLRSQRDAYFVFYPYEPRRQCVVNWDDTNRSFYDTCNARYFDLAGRAIGVNSSQQELLPVPEYQFISAQTIQIDAR